MPENGAPDELFDADGHTLAGRSDWIVRGSGLIRAPVVGDVVPEHFARPPSGGRAKYQPRHGAEHR
ncbi:hypothetical protein [Streptomyces albipurpureus]|uniref:Uncharacterized protein n=1 Tax=Streptomyces albipurpureus TaxID=2897419 RepID=A0ABT0UW46_9ACTN|nr:hypothetical protein [Streptomyces sp. CWNU-1]MCM2392685.1 hypothetical protein [Streptomyces sp. CWNU-1]